MMDKRELAITILGLAGTFLMPWRGGADGHGGPPDRHGTLQAAVCSHRCAEAAGSSSGKAGARAQEAAPGLVAQWRESRSR
jgi:hypothetical protein